MLEDIGVLIFSCVFASSFLAFSSCFTNVIFIALFVMAIVLVYEIAQVSLIKWVFEAEIPGQLGTCVVPVLQRSSTPLLDELFSAYY